MPTTSHTRVKDVVMYVQLEDIFVGVLTMV